jgi:dipeptidyl aminopeptidase/acylaminoacyl peptidase
MEPSLSPDGHDIVYSEQLFAGKCDGCAHTLWRIPTYGGAPEELTSHSDQDPAPFDENPTWSPDGSEIVFQNSGASAPIRLLTMPSTGGPTHDLQAKGAAVPAWGPKLIAYADWSIPHLVVKTLDPSTSVARTVATGGSTDVLALSWSASGRLAYLYNDQHDGHALVAIVGSNAKALDLSVHLPPHARVAGLAWSPDGSRFAFAATDVNGNGEIYTTAIDGSDLRQITHNVGAAFNVGYEGTISWR